MNDDYSSRSNRSEETTTGARHVPRRRSWGAALSSAVLSIGLGLALLAVVPTGAAVGSESPPSGCTYLRWYTDELIVGYPPEFYFSFKRECYRGTELIDTDYESLWRTIQLPDPSYPGPAPADCIGVPWKLNRNGATAEGSPEPIEITVQFYRSCPDGQGGTLWDDMDFISYP